MSCRPILTSTQLEMQKAAELAPNRSILRCLLNPGVFFVIGSSLCNFCPQFFLLWLSSDIGFASVWVVIKLSFWFKFIMLLDLCVLASSILCVNVLFIWLILCDLLTPFLFNQWKIIVCLVNYFTSFFVNQWKICIVISGRIMCFGSLHSTIKCEIRSYCACDKNSLLIDFDHPIMLFKLEANLLKFPKFLS